MRQILSIVLLSSLLLPLGVVSAPIYKWIDEAGQTHYGNQPPQTVQNPEPLEFEAVADDPARRLAAQQSLNDIVALAQQWEAERLTRQRQQREDHLRALETAYYERVLEEQALAVEDEPDRVRIPYTADYPYYRPYPYRHRPYAHHRRHQAEFSLSIGATKGNYIGPRPERPAKQHRGHQRPDRISSDRRTPRARPRAVGLAD
ncbi:MAG: DUF4124 domain-containing protein [Candidatus Competibacteraceae bacterium]|nr:DUF4124 domain-containing protein [Candidatus Competibacteraceae bacterium]